MPGGFTYLVAEFFDVVLWELLTLGKLFDPSVDLLFHIFSFFADVDLWLWMLRHNRHISVTKIKSAADAFTANFQYGTTSPLYDGRGELRAIQKYVIDPWPTCLSMGDRLSSCESNQRNPGVMVLKRLRWVKWVFLQCLDFESFDKRHTYLPREQSLTSFGRHSVREVRC